MRKYEEVPDIRTPDISATHIFYAPDSNAHYHEIKSVIDTLRENPEPVAYWVTNTKEEWRVHLLVYGATLKTLEGDIKGEIYYLYCTGHKPLSDTNPQIVVAQIPKHTIRWTHVIPFTAVGKVQVFSFTGAMLRSLYQAAIYFDTPIDLSLIMNIEQELLCSDIGTETA